MKLFWSKWNLKRKFLKIFFLIIEQRQFLEFIQSGFYIFFRSSIFWTYYSLKNNFFYQKLGTYFPVTAIHLRSITAYLCLYFHCTSSIPNHPKIWKFKLFFLIFHFTHFDSRPFRLAPFQIGYLAFPRLFQLLRSNDKIVRVNNLI